MFVEHTLIHPCFLGGNTSRHPRPSPGAGASAAKVLAGPASGSMTRKSRAGSSMSFGTSLRLTRTL